MVRVIFGLFTHGLALAVGVALGIYLLPILIAPPSLPDTVLETASEGAVYTAVIPEDLAGSDFLHWGEGTFSVTPTHIVHQGSLAPGPDYKLYLVNSFIEDEQGFLPLKETAQKVGSITSFDGFMLEIPPDVDVSAHSVLVVWCETFSEFITAAQYQ